MLTGENYISGTMSPVGWCVQPGFMRRVRIPAMPPLAVVVLIDYAAQVPYYVINYLAPRWHSHHSPPSCS